MRRLKPAQSHTRRETKTESPRAGARRRGRSSRAGGRRRGRGSHAGRRDGVAALARRPAGEGEAGAGGAGSRGRSGVGERRSSATVVPIAASGRAEETRKVFLIEERAHLRSLCWSFRLWACPAQLNVNEKCPAQFGSHPSLAFCHPHPHHPSIFQT